MHHDLGPEICDLCPLGDPLDSLPELFAIPNPQFAILIDEILQSLQGLKTRPDPSLQCLLAVFGHSFKKGCVGVEIVTEGSQGAL